MTRRHIGPAHPAADSGLATYQGIPRMPALFGRQPGPRQRHDRDGCYPTDTGSTLVTWVAAQADQHALTAFLPHGFRIAEPLLIVEAISLSGLPWLAGRGYEMLMISTPVIYTAGGVEHRGRLELVTWENRPEPIISGREELGWSKIYTDSMVRRTADRGTDVHYTAAWEGHTFFELEATLSRGVAHLRPSWRTGPLLHYRVIARTGDWGELEVEQVTSHPMGVPLAAMRSFRPAKGRFRFLPGAFEQLPTLLHVVNSLAAVPLGATVDAGQARIACWNDLHDIRILSSARSRLFMAPPAQDD